MDSDLVVRALLFARGRKQCLGMMIKRRSPPLSGTDVLGSIRLPFLFHLSTPPVTMTLYHPPEPTDDMPCSCLTPCRCSYERASIQEWFDKGNTTSPKTGAQLPGASVTRLVVAAWCDVVLHYHLTGIRSLLVQSSSLSQTMTCARVFRSGKLTGAACRGSCSMCSFRRRCSSLIIYMATAAACAAFPSSASNHSSPRLDNRISFKLESGNIILRQVASPQELLIESVSESSTSASKAQRSQASLPKIKTEKRQLLLASFFTPRVPSDFF